MGNILFNAALQFPVFLFAIVAHEWGHARMAKFYGDDTAERSGRLTFNPMAHADPMGTIFFPLILLMIGSTVFGWAKPVPVAVRNLRDPKNGIFWVSFAGPGMNIILGVISSFLFAFALIYSSSMDASDLGYLRIIMNMLQFSIIINFILAFFNLIPLYPLDGSKMVPRFLGPEALRKYEEFSQYGSYIFMGLIILQYMGIPIFSFLLYPGYWLADFLPRLFVTILA